MAEEEGATPAGALVTPLRRNSRFQMSSSLWSVSAAEVASLTQELVRLDTTNPPGATVSSLFSSNFSDSVDNQPGSSANTFTGIAISSYTVDATKGNWQY